jgi:hypothetical protein
LLMSSMNLLVGNVCFSWNQLRHILFLKFWILQILAIVSIPFFVGKTNQLLLPSSKEIRCRKLSQWKRCSCSSFLLSIFI